ncbi:uncharacterized protein LOC103265271 [Carlito syrichta]|uniref:Uncharacterized protein LOC103265271 n=1 Tax=Carlito syrichta TaxID=1868482 RepID=A0A1U7TXJ8_CARSF|nr:uncharacterized protein LOC103265271 [Carlito syrichta]
MTSSPGSPPLSETWKELRGGEEEEEERAEYTADIISTTVAEPCRTCFTAGGSKTSPVDQQPEQQQPQDIVSLPLPPLPHATPDPFTLYRASCIKSPRWSIQAADLLVILVQQFPPLLPLPGSASHVSILEHNERVYLEASEVMLLWTVSKGERVDSSLHGWS